MTLKNVYFPILACQKQFTVASYSVCRSFTCVRRSKQPAWSHSLCPLLAPNLAALDIRICGKILGSHGGDYDDSLLGYCSVQCQGDEPWCYKILKFCGRRFMMPWRHAGCLERLNFKPEYGGDACPLNVCSHIQVYMTSQPRGWTQTHLSQWESPISGI
jgi:hypothetical protein